ncbi:MAG: BolA/IbaG family iron-sulfur metabolism protein [Marinobacter sp.]|nr:BolA/IbaG family iron-sulfur metabolism protein [Marinobacter sp.]
MSDYHGPLHKQIEAKLAEAFPGDTCQVINESHSHSVPANSETHFKVTLVSASFAGQFKVKRHQRIYALLADELNAGVHALALHLYTPEEWVARDGAAPASPNCMGGSKKEQA